MTLSSNEPNITPVPIADGQLESGVSRRNHTVRVGPPDRRKKNDPDVQILRHGNTVEAIIVRCGCGEEIRINCVYPSRDSNPETH